MSTVLETAEPTSHLDTSTASSLFVIGDNTHQLTFASQIARESPHLFQPVFPSQVELSFLRKSGNQPFVK